MLPIKIVKLLNGNCEDKKIKLPEQLDAKSQGNDICRSNGLVFVALEGHNEVSNVEELRLLTSS